jgi:hypothetical protein
MRVSVALAVAVVGLVAAPSASAATFFHNPSGNITCVVDRTSIARCDIRHRTWTPPPRPRSCPGDWANGMQVGFRGLGRFTCASDAVPAGRELGYGESIRRGRFRCTARRRTGMRCVNLRTEHGFALSRDRAGWF